MVDFIANFVLPALNPGGPPGIIVGHGVAIKWWVIKYYDMISKPNEIG
jgi:hypothetical protein